MDYFEYKRYLTDEEFRNNKDTVINEIPDAVLFKMGNEIDRHVSNYTVPIVFFDGEPSKITRKGNGSGILVRIKHKYFILTAGHCVYYSNGLNKILIIDDKPHRFEPEIIKSNYIFNQSSGMDWGYFEITKHDADTIQSKKKVFLNYENILIINRETLREENDWLIINGYPDALAQPLDTHANYQALFVISTIAGVGCAPESVLDQNDFSFDIWSPKEGNIDVTTDTYDDAKMEKLSGSSGGGCWKTDVRPYPEKWNLSKLKLIGIYIGSYETIIENENCLFYRSIFVSNHLKMIADDYPELELKIE